MGVSENGLATYAKGAGPSGGGSVVLVHHGVPGCDVLLRALSARGLMPELAHDEAGAMLVLAGLDRRHLARRVLIVVEPAAWPRLGEMMAAVRDYHDGIYVWQFDVREGAAPMLSQLETPAAHPVSHGQEDHAGPVGRIRRRTRAVDRLLVSAPGDEPSTRGVVTQQELTMLLGPAPGEAG